MFFSIILISLVLSPCFPSHSNKNPSDYLFGNTELITKADFLEAFEFNSVGLNRNLAALSLGRNSNFPDIPFALYIKENYFELFKSLYLEARKLDASGHRFGRIWKKIYEKILKKTDYQDPNAAFERLFGNCYLEGKSPEAMCTRLKIQLRELHLHKEWPFIFKKRAFGETKFAVTFAFLIFTYLEPSDKHPHHLVSDTRLRTSLDNHYLHFENPRKACLYGPIGPDDRVRPEIRILPEISEPMTTIYFSEEKSEIKVEEKNKGTRKKRTMKRGKNVKNSLKQKKIPRVHYSFNSQNEYINFLNSAEQYPDSQFDQQIDLNASNDRQVELYAPRPPDILR